MTAGVEQLEFQAEARQLLDLLVHSVYSDKDSFLRELISNASDALDKLRIEAFQNKDLDVDASDLHIEIVEDKDARTLSVRDNGIGMTRAEVVDLIGTLAKSGTAELRQQLREAKNAAVSEELIGQFGIGFYSTFMVADKVELLTRKAGGKVDIVKELPGGGTKDLAYRAAEDLLQAHPDLRGIFAINDPSALGARAALEKANRADRLRRRSTRPGTAASHTSTSLAGRLRDQSVYGALGELLGHGRPPGPGQRRSRVWGALGRVLRRAARSGRHSRVGRGEVWASRIALRRAAKRVVIEKIVGP